MSLKNNDKLIKVNKYNKKSYKYNKIAIDRLGNLCYK